MPARDARGRLVIAGSTGLVFVLIPGGSFRMGATQLDEDSVPTTPNVDPEALANESPITNVALDPFFISKYEMTQGQWRTVVGKNPSSYVAGATFGTETVTLSNPVEQVSWDDCDSILGRLGLILPTEAQWEYAARGGTTTPRWTGLGKDGLAKAANLADLVFHSRGGFPSQPYESWEDGYTLHAPVGAFGANPFGLHDVLGNVWEWCRDGFANYGAAPDPGDGLRHPTRLRFRSARGGSFFYDASPARSTYRGVNTADFRSNLIGVRPARRLDRRG
jgi:formylglycine-generating enzyme required for sulfatase activity